eukprot:1154081-Pelagomonas_calceolata.AAC.9
MSFKISPVLCLGSSHRACSCALMRAPAGKHTHTACHRLREIKACLLELTGSLQPAGSAPSAEQGAELDEHELMVPQHTEHTEVGVAELAAQGHVWVRFGMLRWMSGWVGLCWTSTGSQCRSTEVGVCCMSRVFTACAYGAAAQVGVHCTRGVHCMGRVLYQGVLREQGVCCVSKVCAAWACWAGVLACTGLKG